MTSQPAETAAAAPPGLPEPPPVGATAVPAGTFTGETGS
jgi:hypothetical protein